MLIELFSKEKPKTKIRICAVEFKLQTHQIAHLSFSFHFNRAIFAENLILSDWNFMSNAL